MKPHSKLYERKPSTNILPAVNAKNGLTENNCQNISSFEKWSAMQKLSSSFYFDPPKPDTPPASVSNNTVFFFLIFPYLTLCYI